MPGRPGVDELRGLALFRHLPEERLAELARALEVRAVPAGTVVFEEGSPGDALFLLSAGEVRIDKRSEAGGVAEIARLVPGDAFGEMALIESVPRSARAVAHTDAVLLALGRADLERWLRSDPQTAVGFFVELLRVLSRRLRRSSNDVVLLFDLSELTLQHFDDEAGFLLAALGRVIPHLEGEWSVAAYVCSEFSDEVTRVGAVGPRAESLPETLPVGERESRWLDEGTFRVALAGKTPTPLGYLLARNEQPMPPREKGEVEVALTTAGHVIASALLNIRHEAEERLRARLQQRARESGL